MWINVKTGRVTRQGAVPLPFVLSVAERQRSEVEGHSYTVSTDVTPRPASV